MGLIFGVENNYFLLTKECEEGSSDSCTLSRQTMLGEVRDEQNISPGLLLDDLIGAIRIVHWGLPFQRHVCRTKARTM